MKKTIGILIAWTVLTSLFVSVGVCAQEYISMTTGLIGDGGDRVGRLDGLVIGIDAGHQAHGNYEKEQVMPGKSQTKPKVSSGTQGVKTGIPEHEVNLQVALKLRNILENEGCRVIMVRETADVDISNIERAKMMNEAKADLVLRLHCNGVAGSKAKGMEIYTRKTGMLADESRMAAQCVLDGMLEATDAVSRGLHKSDEYTGLNWSEVPSMLVEMGFLTNAQEESLLVDDDYQNRLAEGMLNGIIAYFDEQSD